METVTIQKSKTVSESTNLLDKALNTAELAKAWAFSVQKEDGHWCAELESNATITSEYVMMSQALGVSLEPKKADLIKYFKGNQKENGSWGIAFNYPGDVSTTVECYFALRLLGLERTDSTMKKAEEYIHAEGGIEKVRIFTRINLAVFGLFPWNAIPVIPAEFILLPPESPVNIYSLSSWARSTMVPLFIIFHHKPIFTLPNGKSENNDWLDHLWLNPTKKEIPYTASWMDVLKKDPISYKSFFTAADEFLKFTEKARARAKEFRLLDKIKKTVSPYIGDIADFSLREYAVEKCEEWILERQEKSGDWAGIFPPMVNGVIALSLNGHAINSPAVAKGLEAIERFAIHDKEGFRVQACVSPVWDTVLMMRGLMDCGADSQSKTMLDARTWIENEQITENYGDWKVYNPNGVSGGWAFEYENTWYPDVDDTAAVLITLLKQNPQSTKDDVVTRAAQWIVSMQNRDGGWAAFDLNNDKLFLNQIPFSDMDSLCDPSSPDVAGRVLEAFGILNDPSFKYSIDKGVEYIRKTQEKEGCWFGRWGVNYIYGTSNVLCGLAEQKIHASEPMICRAIEWLKSKQNEDGGWGEKLESYADRELMGIGPSTASQTAWALMGLLAYLPADDLAIQKGIQWLCETQNTSGEFKGAWNEKEFTGTGFPNHFYLRYHYYRHIFPLMALGRYIKKKSQ